MPNLLKKNTKCRICKTPLVEFLSLGQTPPSNAFLKKKDFATEQSYPLRVGFCRLCHLAQLMEVVDKNALFSHYVYFFSVMPTASNHFGAYAEDVIKKFIKEPKKDLIIEIGSNDGLLLKAFQKKRCANVLGIDPAKNIAKFANKNGVPTLADFFSLPLARKIVQEKGRAKVIIGNNVVAHIDNLHDLTRGVDKLLDEKGVFIFEAPYLGDMFENLAYDSIYHEHLSYLALVPLIKLFKQYNLSVFDAQITQRQGNSIRVFVSRAKAYPISANIQKLLDKEKASGMHKLSSYQALAKRIHASKDQLRALLLKLKAEGKTIAGYGAPARGNTILNFSQIGSDILDFATEELPLKIGLYSPGMHVLVRNVVDARKNHPDYYVMLAWNYKDQILKKEAKFIKNGGKFIIPIGDKIEVI